MATQKVRPDPGFVDRQHDHQRRRTRNRRAGVYALVAALTVAIAFVLVRTSGEETERRPVGDGTASPQMPPAAPDVDYLLDLDTGAMIPLPDAIVGTDDEAGGYVVSPDGSMLAYVAPGRDGDPDIFVGHLDGTRVRQLTEHANASMPGWSPDGRQIAYVGDDASGNPNVFVIDVDGGNRRKLTSETGGRLRHAVHPGRIVDRVHRQPRGGGRRVPRPECGWQEQAPRRREGAGGVRGRRDAVPRRVPPVLRRERDGRRPRREPVGLRRGRQGPATAGGWELPECGLVARRLPTRDLGVSRQQRVRRRRGGPVR